MSQNSLQKDSIQNPRVTWEGCSVLLDINDGDRLVFARLSAAAWVFYAQSFELAWTEFLVMHDLIFKFGFSGLWKLGIKTAPCSRWLAVPSVLCFRLITDREGRIYLVLFPLQKVGPLFFFPLWESIGK